MGSLESDLTRAAEWIIAALASAGYHVTYDLEGLAELDRFVGDHTRNGRPKRRGLLAQDMGKRVFALGGVVGETLRRETAGDWLVDDDDPEGEWNVSVLFPDTTEVLPVQLVVRRIEGEIDSLASFVREVVASQNE